MTNAGLLPNYAFPETGIKLSATVFSKRALGDDPANTIDPKTIELVRSASQGIKELAPGNLFYTQKLKIDVKGLELHDNSDSLKVMRFCSACDAIAEEGTPEFSQNVCPKCGNPSWQANKHQYLKFTTATSSVYRDEAALDDRSDDRERKLYHTMQHFCFNHTGPITSYGLKNVAFGIEFCKDVELVEANYGSREQMAEQIEVNNQSHISNLGFITCKYCGKSTAVTYNNTNIKELHFPFCNHKDVSYPPDEVHSDTFLRLFLYRTMQTEAIKVLLPVQLFDTEASTQLFKAGLELGLRHFYQSSPEHLRIDVYREFNRATTNFDNYLVMYDTIPGGTGYLSKLYDTKQFSELLKTSYEHIRDCSCRLEGKDGCYHCILSYGNQWQRKNLSRERAEELFKRIVDECDSWEEVNGSIGTITTSGVIEDSELELVFVKAMKRIAEDKKWSWQKIADPINETYFYILSIDTNDLKVKYTIYPQYRLGKPQGVEFATKPDFQFICSYAEINGNEIDVATVPQWSVYLDGYAFHASEVNNGFENDIKRREAIRKCNNCLRQTWTLTWNDLQSFIVAEEEYGNEIDGLFVSNPVGELLEEFDNDLWHCQNSMQRFLFMLTHPDIDDIRKEAFSYIASCWTDEGQYIVPYSRIDDAIIHNVIDQYCDEVSEQDINDFHFFIKTKFIPKNSILNGSAWYPYDVENNYGDSIRYDWKITNDNSQALDKGDWEDFWRRYNIIQFFNNASSMPIVRQKPNIEEIIILFPGLEDIVEQLVQNEIPFNTEGGFELIENDMIIAEAAIKIEGKNIVIDNFDEETIKLFAERGYQTISPETFNIDNIK